MLLRRTALDLDNTMTGRQNLGMEDKLGKLGMEKIDVMDNL